MDSNKEMKVKILEDLIEQIMSGKFDAEEAEEMPAPQESKELPIEMDEKKKPLGL